MPENFIRRLLILGALAILGIIFIQSYWVIKTWDLKDEEFDHTVRIALRNVAESLSDFNKSELPKQNLIQRRSSNYYAVNINSAINANVLEDFLIQEFTERSLTSDFEYHVFDCATENLVYGNYCLLSDKKEPIDTPKAEIEHKFDSDLIYYFVVKFPNRSGYLLANMRISILFSLVALLAVAYFIYTMWIILRQKRLTEMQKDFINNMTHEFKTPISSIKIAADVLGNSEHIANSDRLSKYASIIKDQNTRLNNQVEKVLSLAKMEKEGFKLNKKSIDIHEILLDIIKSENLRYSQSPDTPIIFNFSDQEIKIEADQLHFSNVIYNILDNALKYSSNSPEVKVSTKINNNKLIIEVIDKGIGVKKEDIPKLFTKFYRVPTGNVHNVKGFGLGLFYVKNISEEHGWQVKFDSIVNEGSTFKITIPNYTT